MTIVDASVAVKWFVRETHGHAAAEEVLLSLERNPKYFAVPDLFFAEMLHVLNRIYTNPARVCEAITFIEQIGFERVGLGHELLQTAAELAGDKGLSGYDAIYAATAQLLGASGTHLTNELTKESPAWEFRWRSRSALIQLWKEALPP